MGYKIYIIQYFGKGNVYVMYKAVCTYYRIILINSYLLL